MSGPDVPLLDLKAQYATIRTEVEEALAEVMGSQAFVLGPVVEGFEAAMAQRVGVPHAVGCASGTDAILLPLRALESEPGHPPPEVIVPAFTFFATAGAVWNAGFRPVFCDVDPGTFNVTADTLDAAWTPRTRAVVPVHLFGQMAPMEEILELAGERGAWVVEDAAQAVDAMRNVDGRPWDSALRGSDEEARAGSMGDAGAFSFFPTKNLGGFGDGGLVTMGDERLAERVAKLRVHGGRQMYHHEMVGTNSRLDALQAAVLNVKLRHLDEWTEARRRNARFYDEALQGLDGVRTPAVEPENFHVYNQYTIRAADREGLRRHLADRGIGAGVYYPVPLHLQACFEGLGQREGDLPGAERVCREVLSLPVFPELGEERAARVVEEVTEFDQQDRKGI